jgi:hypothetical protein
MSQLSQKIKNLKTDKRLYSLNVKMGEVDPKQHETYLQGLEDLSSRSKKLNIIDRKEDTETLNGSNSEIN